MCRKLVVAGTVVLAALACGATSAAAESGRLADFSLGLTSRTPGSPTGLTIHVLFHRADDPNAKPSPLRSAVIHAPLGLRFDTTAVRECTASDDQIRLLGPNA